MMKTAAVENDSMLILNDLKLIRASFIRLINRSTNLLTQGVFARSMNTLPTAFGGILKLRKKIILSIITVLTNPRRISRAFVKYGCRAPNPELHMIIWI